MLSLNINSTSISDGYWLNPIKDYDFEYENLQIYFARKESFGDIDPFRHIVECELTRECGLNDVFAYLHDFKGPIQTFFSTTEGSEIKKWELRNGQYIICKRSSEERREGETKTFEFFARCGIKTPKFETTHIAFDIFRDFEYIKRRYHSQYWANGIDIIEKTCLTDSNSFLVPLANYVIRGDLDIRMPLMRMFEDFKMDLKEFENYTDAILEYQRKNGLQNGEIDVRNFGILVDKNNRATPAVWSGFERFVCTFDSPSKDITID